MKWKRWNMFYNPVQSLIWCYVWWAWQGRVELRRKIMADLGWLISARQGSNPGRTDLFQDKLEQETSLQPRNRCIFQLQQTAPIIIRWLDGIASWALRWTLYDRIPPLVESLSNDSSAVFVYANFSSEVLSACGLGVSQLVWDSLSGRTSCLCLAV